MDLRISAVPAAEKKLSLELLTIPPLLEQARLNLTGNARDLWVTGTGTMEEQVGNLEKLAKQTSGSGQELQRAIRSATQATQEFVAWLEQQAPAKTGPSGVGKEAYTWSLQNVHLVPLTWDDEVALLEAGAGARPCVAEARRGTQPWPAGTARPTQTPKSTRNAPTPPSRNTWHS